MLLMLVFGIIGFGIVMAQQVALNNAARQAARAAVVPGAQCGSAGASGSGIARQAQLDSTTIYLNPNNTTVNIRRGTTMPSTAAGWTAATGCTGSTTLAPCVGSAVGENIYVRVRHVTTLNLPFIQPTFDLSGTGAFRCEYSS